MRRRDSWFIGGGSPLGEQIRERCVQHIREMPQEERWVVTIAKEETARSLLQNSRYWAGAISAAQAWLESQGIKRTKTAIHEFLKQEIYGLKLVEIKGKVQMAPIRSSKMSKKKFAEFSERAEAYVIEEWGVPPEMIDFHFQDYEIEGIQIGGKNETHD